MLLKQVRKEFCCNINQASAVSIMAMIAMHAMHDKSIPRTQGHLAVAN